MLPPFDSSDDASLLAAIEQGSHAAFAVLVRRHHTRFYAIAYRFLANQQEAEDMVQHSLLKLWESPSMWDARKQTKFTTWFYRIIVNQCLDARKKKTAVPLPEEKELIDHRPSQDQLLLLREKQQILETAILALPDKQQTALNLCFYENFSNQEAADIMGIKLKALQSLLIRAKETLRKNVMRVL